MQLAMPASKHAAVLCPLGPASCPEARLLAPLSQTASSHGHAGVQPAAAQAHGAPQGGQTLLAASTQKPAERSCTVCSFYGTAQGTLTQNPARSRGHAHALQSQSTVLANSACGLLQAQNFSTGGRTEDGYHSSKHISTEDEEECYRSVRAVLGLLRSEPAAALHSLTAGCLQGPAEQGDDCNISSKFGQGQVEGGHSHAVSSYQPSGEGERCLRASCAALACTPAP